MGPGAEEGGHLDLLGRGPARQGRDEGATLVIQVESKKGWFWYIPLHNNIISVGVVGRFDYLFKDRGAKDHEAIYFEEVDALPGLQAAAGQSAKRVGPFRATKDYSYRSTQAAGDGWVLVGDAFGFLDPLYSSGVLLALKSGQLAADAIAGGAEEERLSAGQLGKWGPTSTAAWTACAGWSSNTTTASASASSSPPSAPQGPSDRSADGRSVPGTARRGLARHGSDAGGNVGGVRWQRLLDRWPSEYT